MPKSWEKTGRGNLGYGLRVQNGKPVSCLHLAYNQLRRSLLTTLLAAALLILLALWFRCKFSSTAGITFFSSMPAAGGDNLTLVILPKAEAEKVGAVCLDGSPPSYYIRKAKSGQSQSSWLVTLQGGGWCWNVSDCYRRSLTDLGSSRRLAKEMDFGGVMSRNTEINPDFYDWNMVMINYCDGASFSGNLESPVIYYDSTIYFRGKRILTLVFRQLLKTEGLERAKRVILSGVSAGGLAVYLHGDYIRDLIPAGVPVHCLADAGFFMDYQNVSGYYHYQTHMHDVLDMQNAQGSLNQNCLKTLEEEDGWHCFFAPISYIYMTTPLFTMNSASDYWQLWFILDLRCHPSQCPDKLPLMRKFHASLVEDVTRQPWPRRHARDGWFISSCYAHSQSFHSTAWMTYRVGGKTARQAFGDWYFGRTAPGESRYVDCSTSYDCNPSCAESWTLAFYNKTTERMKSSTPDF